MKPSLFAAAVSAAVLQVATSGAQPSTSPLAAGLEAARTTDYAAAEKALSAVVGADRPAALLTLARVELEQGRFADADRHATQAASGPAQRLAATALRGEILAARGDVDDAIKLLEPNRDAPGAGGRRVRLVLGELLIRAAGGRTPSPCSSSSPT